MLHVGPARKQVRHPGPPVRWLVLCVVAVTMAGCRQPAPSRQYELQGQVLEVRTDRNEVVIKHGDIKGFMPGMTMPFTVKPSSLAGGVRAGDLVTATLVVEEVDAYLSSLTKTGEAPLPEGNPVPAAPTALQPGQPIADAALVDQDATPVFFSSYKGHRVALTFIYTRCPIPDFCPLMDRQFKKIQDTLAARPDLADVRLVTVTLDPAFDTPAVLKPYASRRGADPRVWSFLTGDVTEVARFGEQFGLYIEHDARDSADLLHNLRTAVIDASGRLVAVHNGNAWTTTELLADLAAAPAATR